MPLKAKQGPTLLEAGGGGPTPEGHQHEDHRVSSTQYSSHLLPHNGCDFKAQDNTENVWAERSKLQAGVDILAFAPINIVEINKQFDKTWKGIRKIQHF